MTDPLRAALEETDEVTALATWMAAHAAKDEPLGVIWTLIRPVLALTADTAPQVDWEAVDRWLDEPAAEARPGLDVERLMYEAITTVVGQGTGFTEQVARAIATEFARLTEKA